MSCAWWRGVRPRRSCRRRRPAGSEAVGPVRFDPGVPINGVAPLDNRVSADLEPHSARQRAHVDVHTLEHPDAALRGLVDAGEGRG